MMCKSSLAILRVRRVVSNLRCDNGSAEDVRDEHTLSYECTNVLWFHCRLKHCVII